MPKAPTKKPTPKASPVEANGKVESAEREVLYPAIQVWTCVGEKALTASKAKKLLGWEEETDKVKFGPDYVLTDEYGHKVRLHNNTKNRMYDPGNARTLQYEILNKNWKLNGETIIIGRTGETIDFQHRGVALILAVQAWERDKEKWYKWETQPTLECIVVLGIDESDLTVNTINTGRRRSFADAVFRSGVFEGSNKGDRGRLSRILECAVKVVWHRTGMKINAFAPRPSHAELFDFVHHHHHLVDATKHMFEEDGDGKIGKYLPAGYAAGMLYLMGQGKTEPTKYRTEETKSESHLDFSLWDEACDFWVKLAKGGKEMAALDAAISKLGHDSSDGRVTREVMILLIVKSWLCVAHGKRITYDAIEPEFGEKDGKKVLVECPTVGGIDIGKPQEHEEPDSTEDVGDDPDADSDQEMRADEDQEVSKPPKKNGKGKAPKFDPQPKDVVWVLDEDGDNWQGVLVEVYGKVGAEVAKVKAANGKIWEVPAANLRSEEP